MKLNSYTPDDNASDALYYGDPAVRAFNEAPPTRRLGLTPPAATIEAETPDDTLSRAQAMYAAQVRPVNAPVPATAPKVGFNPKTGEIFSAGKTYDSSSNLGLITAFNEGAFDQNNTTLPPGFKRASATQFKQAVQAIPDWQKEIEAGARGYGANMALLGGTITGSQGMLDTYKEQRAKADTLAGASTAPKTFDEAEFGENMWDYVRQLGLQSLPYMAEAIVTGFGAGALLKNVGVGAAKKMAEGAIAREAEAIFNGAIKAGLPTITREAALAQAATKVGTQFARGAGVVAGTYPSAVGDILSNQVEQAGGDVNATRGGVAAILGAPYAALNLLGGEGLIAGTNRAIARQAGLAGLRAPARAGAALGITTGGEMVNETGQEVLNQAGRVSVDPTASMLSPEALGRYREAAIGGGILGAAMGGVGAVQAARGAPERRVGPEMLAENAAAERQMWDNEQATRAQAVQAAQAARRRSIERPVTEGPSAPLPTEGMEFTGPALPGQLTGSPTSTLYSTAFSEAVRNGATPEQAREIARQAEIAAVDEVPMEPTDQSMQTSMFDETGAPSYGAEPVAPAVAAAGETLASFRQRQADKAAAAAEAAAKQEDGIARRARRKAGVEAARRAVGTMNAADVGGGARAAEMNQRVIEAGAAEPVRTPIGGETVTPMTAEELAGTLPAAPVGATAVATPPSPAAPKAAGVSSPGEKLRAKYPTAPSNVAGAKAALPAATQASIERSKAKAKAKAEKKKAAPAAPKQPADALEWTAEDEADTQKLLDELDAKATSTPGRVKGRVTLGKKVLTAIALAIKAPLTKAYTAATPLIRNGIAVDPEETKKYAEQMNRVRDAAQKVVRIAKQYYNRNANIIPTATKSTIKNTKARGIKLTDEELAEAIAVEGLSPLMEARALLLAAVKEFEEAAGGAANANAVVAVLKSRIQKLEGWKEAGKAKHETRIDTLLSRTWKEYVDGVFDELENMAIMRSGEIRDSREIKARGATDLTPLERAYVEGKERRVLKQGKKETDAAFAVRSKAAKETGIVGVLNYLQAHGTPFESLFISALGRAFQAAQKAGRPLPKIVFGTTSEANYDPKTDTITMNREASPEVAAHEALHAALQWYVVTHPDHAAVAALRNSLKTVLATDRDTLSPKAQEVYDILAKLNKTNKNSAILELISYGNTLRDFNVALTQMKSEGAPADSGFLKRITDMWRRYVALMQAMLGVTNTVANDVLQSTLDLLNAATENAAARPGASKGPKLNILRDAGAEHGKFRPATAADIKRLKIPPGWTEPWVQIDERSSLVAIGWDGKGQMKRLYSKEHTAAAIADKHSRGRKLHEAMPALLQRLDRDANAGVEEAIVLRLIANSGFRVGSPTPAYMQERGPVIPAFGASTLLQNHVTVGDGSVTFRFTGKGGVSHEHVVTDPDVVFDVASRKAQTKEDHRLFSTTDRKIRDYLDKVAPGFVVHDLRTYAANAAALNAMEKMATPTTAEEFWIARDAVGEVAAKKLGDTLSVALEDYVDTKIFDEWRIAAGVSPEATKPKTKRGKKGGDDAGAAEAAATDGQVLPDDGDTGGDTGVLNATVQSNTLASFNPVMAAQPGQVATKNLQDYNKHMVPNIITKAVLESMGWGKVPPLVEGTALKVGNYIRDNFPQLAKLITYVNAKFNVPVAMRPLLGAFKVEKQISALSTDQLANMIAAQPAGKVMAIIKYLDGDATALADDPNAREIADMVLAHKDAYVAALSNPKARAFFEGLKFSQSMIFATSADQVASRSLGERKLNQLYASKSIDTNTVIMGPNGVNGTFYRLEEAGTVAPGAPAGFIDVSLSDNPKPGTVVVDKGTVWRLAGPGTEKDTMRFTARRDAEEAVREGKADEVANALRNTMSILASSYASKQLTDGLANPANGFIDNESGVIFSNVEKLNELLGRKVNPNAILKVGSPEAKSIKLMGTYRTQYQWMQLPTSATYGAMSGKLVRSDVWAAIQDMTDRTPLHNIEALHTTMRVFKKAKTVYNPATHVVNIGSNFTLAMLHDIPFNTVRQSARMLWQYNRNPNAMSLEERRLMHSFVNSGAMLGDFSSIEVKQALHDAIRDAAALNEPRGIYDKIRAFAGMEASKHNYIKKLVDAGGKIDDIATGLYAAEDNAFRLAAFLKKAGEIATKHNVRTLTQEQFLEAGDFARSAFLDYDIDSKAVKVLRQTVLPFVSWTYAILPVLGRIALHQPWKIMNVLMGYMLLDMAMGGDDDDEVRKQGPEWARSRLWGIGPHTYIRVPFVGDDKNPIYFKLGAYIPTGNWADKSPNGFLGLSNWPIPLNPSGPYTNFVIGAMGGVDPYTGKPLSPPTASDAEKAAARTAYLAKSFAPPWAPTAVDMSSPVLGVHGRPERDSVGNPVNNLIAARHFGGLQVYGYSTADVMMQRRRASAAIAAEFDKEIRRIRRQESRYETPDWDRFNRRRDELMEREQERLDELKGEE